MKSEIESATIKHNIRDLIKDWVIQQRIWKLKHAVDVDCVKNMTRQ
jgi:ribosomal protein L19E